MFQDILLTVKSNINTVRSIIKTNDNLMKFAFASDDLIKTEINEKTDLFLSNLLQDIPKATEWRIYDHCAVVTRLYAVYERFVEELISDWLILLPELYPQYSDLDETCYLVTIKSIEIDDISVNNLQTNIGMEVGLKFDLSAKKGLHLYQLEIE